MKKVFRSLGLVASTALASCALGSLEAGEPGPLHLRPTAAVISQGVFLNSLVESEPPVPNVRLCDAPAFGKILVVPRVRIAELATASGSGLVLTNWEGANAVQISRRSRKLADQELVSMLTEAFQRENVKDKGELELRLTRPWPATAVPDEELTLRVVELPSQGITPAFLTRFELRTAQGETVGSWQASLQAHVWRDVWVARSTLSRGAPLRETDLSRERRDVLNCREAPAEFELGDPSLEICEPVAAGSPLLARCVKPRPIIHRGQSVAAVLEDGALAISLKVEAMEDGLPGQIIRIRNPLSRRDLRGKVMDDKRIQVCL